MFPGQSHHSRNTLTMRQAKLLQKYRIPYRRSIHALFTLIDWLKGNDAADRARMNYRDVAGLRRNSPRYMASTTNIWL